MDITRCVCFLDSNVFDDKVLDSGLNYAVNGAAWTIIGGSGALLSGTVATVAAAASLVFASCFLGGPCGTLAGIAGLVAILSAGVGTAGAVSAGYGSRTLYTDMSEKVDKFLDESGFYEFKDTFIEFAVDSAKKISSFLEENGFYEFCAYVPEDVV